MCLGEGLCYLEDTVITDYLNSASIRKLLGVESPRNFSACSRDVGASFRSHMDKYYSPTQFYVSSLLERGVRMLIYAGTYDWQCNWVANKLWVEKLEWEGKEAFNEEDWRTWSVDGEGAGITKSSGVLTFASVWGAGHMMSHSLLSTRMARLMVALPILRPA